MQKWRHNPGLYLFSQSPKNKLATCIYISFYPANSSLNGISYYFICLANVFLLLICVPGIRLYSRDTITDTVDKFPVLIGESIIWVHKYSVP